MKKFIVFAAIFAFAVAVFFVAGGSTVSTSVSAQNRSNPGMSQPAPGDSALATLIKRLTDRSTDNLVEKRSADGTIDLDLGEGFQNVMVARAGTDGEPVSACITSIGEANEFFGRDLETGAPIDSKLFRVDEVSKTAARHGMSRDEFLFYKKMIEEAEARRALSPEAATLAIVNGDGAGEGFNDPTTVDPEGGNNGTTRGEQRLNLFQFAAAIWGAQLDSGVQIDINAQFNTLTPCTTSGGVLGSAGSNGITANFTGAPLTGVWYHRALANKVSGTDTNGVNPEINARFNTDVDNGCLGAGSRFYYGLNNSTPSARINLLVVLLHEMGHGLGFSAAGVNGSTGALTQGLPDVFLLHMLDTTTNKRWRDMTNAERQASAINPGGVVFDGANVKIASSFLNSGRANDGSVELFTPNPFQQGSSVSHFNTVASPSLLMEPSITPGLPLTLDLTRQVMRDIGWYRDTDGDRVPDTITNVNLGGTPTSGQLLTVRWTNNGGFNRNVTIELSTNGGNSYETVLAEDTQNGGTFTFTVPNITTSTARIRVREAGFVDPVGQSAVFTIGNSQPRTTRYDFDGDGKADVSLFRPSEGNWYIQNSATGGVSGVHFGNSSDLTAPGDFDGDGKADISVFRPSEGNWYRLNSSTGAFVGIHFGNQEDLPAVGDFDGDGKTDISVFRPSEGNWYRLNSTDGGFVGLHFGSTGDKPAVGDFDGDGKADISVFRPSEGNWYRLNSSDGGFAAVRFGNADDRAVPADYDGDGKTDIAVYRATTGEWFRLNSANGGFFGMAFGTAGDKPVPADYDGDGKADIAVYRPSEGNWYFTNSTSGFGAIRFGAAEDAPAPNSFIF